jgi:poly-gamma-glutamate capsule biosynthesis protein CapA/YwtB (metallophosphatase superfamily)
VNVEAGARVTLALAGDTMLGRGVARALESAPPTELFAPEVLAAAREADLFVVNLECSISARGERRPDPGKPFFFRAPPVAVEVLGALGVDCVTLANNHALDYGPVALLDTLDHLHAAGIATVGAGRDVAEARRPVVLEAKGLRLGVIGVTDHPAEWAAGADSPGVAFDPLGRSNSWRGAPQRAPHLPEWLSAGIAGLEADAVLVTPHWGPNMTTAPEPRIRATAARLLEAGATVVAGHSAHVFHGVEGTVLYDLGDFLDDYARDPALRNDLGLLFLLELDRHGPVRLAALPLELEFCHTRLARGDDWEWVRRRFSRACAELGTAVAVHGDRLVVDWRAGREPGAAGSPQG